AGPGMQPLHLVTARSQFDGIGTTAWEVGHILDTRSCQQGVVRADQFPMRTQLPVSRSCREESVERFQCGGAKVVDVAVRPVARHCRAFEAGGEVTPRRSDLPGFPSDRRWLMDLVGLIGHPRSVSRLELIAELGVENGLAARPVFGDAILQARALEIPAGRRPLRWILHTLPGR